MTIESQKLVATSTRTSFSECFSFLKLFYHFQTLAIFTIVLTSSISFILLYAVVYRPLQGSSSSQMFENDRADGAHPRQHHWHEEDGDNQSM